MTDVIIPQRHCNAKIDLTAEFVREILDYDPETGVFTWRHRADRAENWNSRWAGKRAGAVMMNGYWLIGIRLVPNGKDQRYLGHRLAWLHFYGKWPADQIDHIDLCRANNAIANLREANNSGNNSNRTVQRNNVSGFKGVYFHHHSGLWTARVQHRGKVVWWGYFHSPEEAATAYGIAARRIHGDFSRT